MPLPTKDAERKALPLWTFLTEFFPDAIIELVRVAQAGNEQHSPGEPLHWARGKSMDQLNTAARHLWDHSTGAVKDTDGMYHLAKAAWRVLAELQLRIEKDTAPVALEDGTLVKPGEGVPMSLGQCRASWCGLRCNRGDGHIGDHRMTGESGMEYQWRDLPVGEAL